MGAVNNVIELVFRVRDQTAGQINGIKNRLVSSTGSMNTAATSLARSAVGLSTAFVGVAAGAVGLTSAASALHKVVEASAEAELVLKRFDIAFRNIGATSGRTRDDLVKFADDFSKKSIFDDEKILQAETALLQFRKVSGDTFDRVRKDAIDLASATGGDLSSAMELLGRSVERPEIAIRRLRAAGILFTAAQEKMIKSLTETGQRSKAAEIILGEVERRVKGAGQEIAGTLTGSLARLKTAWDNLFETDTGPLTEAVSGLADVINDPQFRKNMQELATLGIKFLGGIANAATSAVSAWESLMDLSARWQANSNNPFSGEFFDVGSSDAQTKLGKELDAQLQKISDLKVIYNEYNAKVEAGRMIAVGYRDEIGKQIKTEEAYAKTLGQRIKLLNQSAAASNKAAAFRKSLDEAADQFITGVVAGGAAASVGDEFEEMKEVVVKVFKQSTGAMNDFYDKLDERTKTSYEKETENFYAFKAALDESYQNAFDALNDALSKGTISWEEYHKRNLKLNADYNARFKEALDDTLSEVVVTVKKEALPALKTAWDKMYDTFAEATERMLNNGRFTWRELGLYLLREIEVGAIKIALDALRKAIKDAMKSSSSSGGGFWSTLIKGIVGGISGSSSGGGSTSQPSGRAGGGIIPRSGAWVGENGAEWAMGPGMVYNSETVRAMLGGGGGSKVTFAPVTSITVNGDAREKEVSDIKDYIDAKNNGTQKLILQMLERQNLKRPR